MNIAKEEDKMDPIKKLRLGVNIDHVATVRNARGSAYPDPVRGAIIAQEAGADGMRRRMTISTSSSGSTSKRMRAMWNYLILSDSEYAQW